MSGGSTPPSNQPSEPVNACIDNPQLPGCPQIPQSLRCIAVPVPTGGSAQVCLDEDNEVWDMAGEVDAIVDQMTTRGFCEDLRIDSATEAVASIVAGSLFVGTCAAKGAAAGGPAGSVAAGAVCGGLAAGAGYKIVNACKAKWGVEW